VEILENDGRDIKLVHPQPINASGIPPATGNGKIKYFN
jgi:hypothetical protein